MKSGKSLLCILSVFLVLAMISISATADGVNQTPEIQGITTSTYIDVVGLASSSSDLPGLPAVDQPRRRYTLKTPMQ